jgi:hypothetical protein
MQTRQGIRLGSLRAVSIFLTTNADRLPDVVNTGARRKFDEILTELEQHAADQEGSTLMTKGATRKLHAQRRALVRDHMLPVSTIAHAEFIDTPEVEPFRLPRGNPTVQKLAASAHGMAKAAEPHAELFISSGLHVDFLQRLDDAADALLASDAERSQRSGKRRGATKGLKTKLAAARRYARVLDALVQSALHDDPVLLATWNSVRHVRRLAGRPPLQANAIAADVPRVASAPLRLLPEQPSSALHLGVASPVEYAQLNPGLSSDDG